MQSRASDKLFVLGGDGMAFAVERRQSVIHHENSIGWLALHFGECVIEIVRLADA